MVRAPLCIWFISQTVDVSVSFEAILFAVIVTLRVTNLEAQVWWLHRQFSSFFWVHSLSLAPNIQTDIPTYTCLWCFLQLQIYFLHVGTSSLSFWKSLYQFKYSCVTYVNNNLTSGFYRGLVMNWWIKGFLIILHVFLVFLFNDLWSRAAQQHATWQHTTFSFNSLKG